MICAKSLKRTYFVYTTWKHLTYLHSLVFSHVPSKFTFASHTQDSIWLCRIPEYGYLTNLILALSHLEYFHLPAAVLI